MKKDEENEFSHKKSANICYNMYLNVEFDVHSILKISYWVNGLTDQENITVKK